MVTTTGAAKLLDFGIAKHVAAEVDVTRTVDGTVVGTTAYMSPEQAEGRLLDQRSDVFSFGALLYEMLSGRSAFGGQTAAQVLGAVLRDDPMPLRASPAVERIVRRCLDKQPALRFQTMTEVKAALEAAAASLAPQPAELQPSIAVLPFADMSPGKDHEKARAGCVMPHIGMEGVLSDGHFYSVSPGIFESFPSVLHRRIIRPKSTVPTWPALVQKVRLKPESTLEQANFPVRRNGVKNLIIVIGCLVATGPALAHHGAANVYDMSKPLMLKGTITKFEWTNPHNQIFFDVTDEKGTVTHWIAATEPPQVMLERGWTRRSLKTGDEVTLYVFAAKNGAKVGNVQRIVLADGKELVAAGPPAAPAPAR